MNLENTLVIYNSVKHFIPFFQKKGINVYPIYKDVGFLSKLLRKLFSYLGLNRHYWFADWKHEIKNQNIKQIILFANDEDDIWKLLEKREGDVIFWYWNPISIYRKGTPKNLPKSFRPFSFDPVDCKQYKIKFNTTFYFNNIELESSKIQYDIVFVGMDKGRRRELEQLKINFDELGVSNFIYIVGNRDRLGKYEGNKPISYGKYLECISKSKVILDLVQTKQSGLTLRAMESIFFKKKLITNDLTIIEQPFYNSNNIFLIGKDNILELSRFIETDYIPLEESIVNSFDVTCWLKRFSEE